MPDPNSNPNQFYENAITEVDVAKEILAQASTALDEEIEHSMYKLRAVQSLLVSVDDPDLTNAARMEMVEGITRVLVDLESTLADKPHPNLREPSKEHTGHPGRPAYSLNLTRVFKLHDLGITFIDIANIFKVSRKTLYNHLERAGLSSARPLPSLIDDDALDSELHQILANHPFVGSTIIQGHLLTKDLHIPICHVKQSLLRVDPLSVMSR